MPRLSCRLLPYAPGPCAPLLTPFVWPVRRVRDPKVNP